MGFEEVLITPAVNEVLKAVTAKYTAVELVSSRAEVSMLLDDGLNEKLNAYGIFINELNIINWDFSEEYINAVEAKQVAEQNLIKTRTEQEQALVIANTEAQKRVIAAEAEANEIKVLAEANAESNRILNESISELLIRYQSVSKWDGKLPTVMSGGDNMLIDIPLPTEQPMG
jgi:regulator of protease activity HflC (stomatin/prohibitin superfamily)